MPKNDYLPPRDNDFLGWHDHFNSALAALKTIFGLTDPEVTAVGADNTSLHDAMTNLANADAAYQQAARAKAAARLDIERRVRALVRRLKSHPAYTEVHGAQLDILGTEDTTDLTTAKPLLNATALPHGDVEIAFTKSKSEGVNIYSQREGEAGFSFLTRDTNSPYVDNRPLATPGKAEVRKYKATYVLDDQEIGEFSAEVQVACTP